MVIGDAIKYTLKNPALIPLFAAAGVGAFGCTFYVLRLALKNPDVSWNMKKNPEPNNEYANKQYKFYSPGFEEAIKTIEKPPSF